MSLEVCCLTYVCWVGVDCPWLFEVYLLFVACCRCCLPFVVRVLLFLCCCFGRCCLLFVYRALCVVENMLCVVCYVLFVVCGLVHLV